MGLFLGLVQRNREMSRQGYIVMAGGILAAAMFYGLLGALRRRRVPPALRTIDRTPINPKGFRAVFEIPEAETSSPTS